MVFLSSIRGRTNYPCPECDEHVRNDVTNDGDGDKTPIVSSDDVSDNVSIDNGLL